MKKLLLYFLMPLSLLAECTYKINMEIFPSEHRLSAEVDIKNSEKNIELDFANFDLKKEAKKELNFKYEKKLKEQIEKDFIFLGDGWLPRISSLCKYELTVTLPKDFIAISESESITESKDGDKITYNFKMQKPIDTINLIASKKFVVKSQKYKGILISTYFFKEHANLSDSYIKKVKYYIDMYEKMLGEFPYSTFRVVENSFQTGYSMPTFTLIGDRIIDKPFLIDISLGHEIVHQWFGNSVFNNFEKGNWVEGITTYLSDHYYKELKGEGWKYRKKILNDYEAYVNEKNHINLSEFRHRKDRATMAIGYGKGAFAFHSLREEIGDKLFFKGLKEFYKTYRGKYATYGDIGEFFEKFSDKNASEIIHNLFEHKDIVDINPTKLTIGYEDNSYKLNFTIPHNKDIQHGYNLPLLVKTIDANESFSLFINGDTNVSLALKNRPLELVFDRDYDLFRKLSIDESATNIAKLLGDNNLTIVTDSDRSYEKIFSNSKLVKRDALTFKQMQNSNILFLQDAKAEAKKALTNISKLDDGLLIEVERNPWNRTKVVAYLEALSEKELKKSLRKIPHYSKYSRIIFQDGKIKEKSITPTTRGKVYEVGIEKLNLEVPQAKTLEEIIEKVANKRVIFIGEAHTNYAHHINQLQIIKALHKRGKKVAIGMEMFQRKFQNILDDYLAGKIDEKTFLEKSEYFTRWKFNYNLYKPIIDFAKENSLPVIALNIEKEIIKKITKNGFHALNDEEKELLPKTLNFQNQEYKKYLQNFFNSSAHPKAKGDKNSTSPNTDFIYQSQIVWDETMAETASKYIKKNSDTTFIVLAGNGHIAGFSGIPDRVFRELNLPQSVIIQDMPASENSADFILYTNTMKVKEPMKIGVFLDTTKNLKVTKVIEDSIAKKVGLKKDDIILAVDGIDVKKLDDLKFLLFFKDKDEKIEIKVMREEKLLNLFKLKTI